MTKVESELGTHGSSVMEAASAVLTRDGLKIKPAKDTTKSERRELNILITDVRSWYSS